MGVGAAQGQMLEDFFRLDQIEGPDIQLPDRCSVFFRPLIQELLPSLPSYTNRTWIRNQGQIISVGPLGLPLEPQPSLDYPYVVAVGKPDFRGIPLEPWQQQYPHLDFGSLVALPSVQQVFLTSLERRYQGGSVTQVQVFHWLFFQRDSQNRWQLLRKFSVSGGYPQAADDPSRIPQDSSQDALAQALRQQLQACQSPVP